MASSRAARTNRFLALFTGITICAAGVAAWTQGTRIDDGRPTTTQAPQLTSPSDTTGRRPAEVGSSWFNHGFGAEQFDFEMPALSCARLNDTLTPDVCGVARTSSGSFMVVGTEGFWDPGEVDADGNTWVPFDVTVYVLRTDLEGTRAVSVMDGFTTTTFTETEVVLEMYIATINGQEVIVLHQRLADPAGDAFDVQDSVQIIAMSPTGAPTVVATYRGFQLQVGSTGTSIELSSLRYRTNETNSSNPLFTRISLAPMSKSSDPYIWSEIVTSSKDDVPNGQAMDAIGRYVFPTPSASLANF